jgi:hypothetical protein
MTEAEWLTCDDPEAMHAVVAEGAFQSAWPHGSRTARKRVFFSAACCRLVWPWIVVDNRCRRAVEYLENQFDRTFTSEEAEEILLDVKDADRHPDAETPLLQLAGAGLVYDAGDTQTTIGRLLRCFEGYGDLKERAVQISHIMRCIVGNPFRPVSFDPAWRTSTVVALAQGMYDARDFSPMPILADALQDAGCDNDDILNHCRGSGLHVRGCWVVDLVLGKA